MMHVWGLHATLNQLEDEGNTIIHVIHKVATLESSLLSFPFSFLYSKTRIIIAKKMIGMPIIDQSLV